MYIIVVSCVDSTRLINLCAMIKIFREIGEIWHLLASKRDQRIIKLRWIIDPVHRGTDPVTGKHQPCAIRARQARSNWPRGIISCDTSSPMPNVSLKPIFLM